VSGFTDRLGHGRVRVDRANQLLDRALHPQGDGRFGHQLGRARSDDVDAEDLIIFLLGDDLHDAALADDVGLADPAEVELLAAQFGSADAYRARLQELGLTAESVARNVERQIYLARYLDYKLRPAAQVEIAQVEKYFREELVPELRKRGQEAPSLESVEGQIRELLTQREISARAARWLEETRARLRIEIAGKKNVP